MNERSFIVKSLSEFPNSESSRHADSRPATSRLSFKIRDLIPTLPDDATCVGPDMAPALVDQSAADWVPGQTARSKQSRSNRKARKQRFP
jgi:hypothetical protein